MTSLAEALDATIKAAVAAARKEAYTRCATLAKSYFEGGTASVYIARAIEQERDAPCSPTMTECPRCHNDIMKCDGMFRQERDKESA